MSETEKERARAFGQSVRTRRLALGLSQADLARRIDKSPAWVCLIETGQIKKYERWKDILDAALPAADEPLTPILAFWENHLKGKVERETFKKHAQNGCLKTQRRGWNLYVTPEQAGAYQAWLEGRTQASNLHANRPGSQVIWNTYQALARELGRKPLLREVAARLGITKQAVSLSLRRVRRKMEKGGNS